MKRIIENMTALSNVDDVNVVVGTATVCSDCHFDGWAVNLDGVWMYRKDLARWFFHRIGENTWWLVLSDDEVSFEGGVC